MDDTPPAPSDDGGIGRRWFLLGGGVLVAAGAATGSVVRLARQDDDPAAPDPAPAALTAAVARERALLADLDATTGGSATVRAVITRTRADHAAHLDALEQALRGYDEPAPSATGTATATAVPGTPRTVAQLRAAELRASAQYADAAERSGGRLATLLASIAACEASHAGVLR